MKGRIEQALTLILALAAVVVAVSAAKREFFPLTPQRETIATFEPAWRDALQVGLRTGDSTARVAIIVFSDLECPACAAFHETLKEITRTRGHEVATVFVHYPLASHRFALPAARAAECAAARGRFSQFEDVVYRKRDSLGIKSWGAYALEAGIGDTAAIAACARDPKAVGRIEAGRELGQRWQIRGTPTVFINDKRFQSVPSNEEIELAIRGALTSPAR